MEPTETPIDAEFERFQRHGDADALGRVFDAVAPKLLLVAGHLTRGNHDAEDLVQATFIEAIHHRQRWTRERPLFPWLCGILSNLARRQQRRRSLESRVTERGGADVGIDQNVHDDPAMLAASRDEWDHLVAAIDRLEPTYRRALTLRILHGMSSVHIADLLGERPETIRTRIHRGITQLRGMVPASMATSIALLVSGRGFAAMRNDVMAAAGGGTASFSIATTIGGWMMRKSVALALTVGLIGVPLIVGFLFKETGTPPASPRPTIDASIAHSDLLPPSPTDATEPSTLSTGERELAVEARSTPILADPSAIGWRVRGVVRDAEGGAIAGATVRAKVDQINDALDVESITTPDGKYELSLESLRASSATQRLVCTLSIHAYASGFLPNWVTLNAHLPADLDAPFDHDLNLSMEAGPVVSGRLTNRVGNGVEGAKIEIMSSSPADDPDGRSHGSEWGESDASGYFALRRFPRKCHIEFTADHHQVGSVRLEREVENDDLDVDLGVLVLREAPAVFGRLYLTDQSPLDNYPIRLVADGSKQQRLLTTDARGEFRSIAPPPGVDAIEVDGAFLKAQRFAFDATGRAAERAVEGHLLTLRAVDRLGELLPTVSFDFQAWQRDEIPSDLDQAVAEGRSPRAGPCYFRGGRNFDGEFRLLLPAGAALFCVVGHDELGRQAVAVRIDESECRPIRTLVFEPPIAKGYLQLNVADELGDPIASYQAQLFTEAGFFPLATWSGDTSPPLAPGRYRLHVQSGRYRNSIYFNLMHQSTHVVGLKGLTESVGVVIPRGGLLRVTIASSPDEPIDGARLEITGPDGPITNEPFYYVENEDPFLRATATLEPGVPLLRSPPLPIGSYRVRFTRPNHDDTEHLVTIQPEKVTDLTLP